MGPVLKEAVLGWLCEPPLARLVMAFASAVPEHGGAGATYVLLRRQRARRGKAEPRAQ
jgi:DNA-nicking Smr family endonuclease